jgi:hypothetical protein
MAMSKQLWSLNALSVELQYDRRTLGKWLSDLKPADEKPRGGKLYFLKDVLRHIKQLPQETLMEAIPDDRIDFTISYTVAYMGHMVGKNLPNILRTSAACEPQTALDVADFIMLVYCDFADKLCEELHVTKIDPKIPLMPWYGDEGKKKVLAKLQKMTPERLVFERVKGRKVAHG